MKDIKINNLREELMNEIKTISKDVSEIKIDIAKLPELLAEKFDGKYASKKIEEDVGLLTKTVGDLNVWKVKVVSILSVILFILTFLKDPLLKALNIE
jgi:hypothetical protein